MTHRAQTLTTSAGAADRTTGVSGVIATALGAVGTAPATDAITVEDVGARVGEAAEMAAAEAARVAEEAALDAMVEGLMPGVPGAARVPRATYRLQLNGDFTFRDARRVVPYLAELGVSDIYASPYLKARPGSTHGYDVDDYNRLNPELGEDGDYEAFLAALDRHDLGHILDFVPNHMGIGRGTNAWWMDVLENGRSSPHSGFFDIDWDPIKPDLRDKVLLPFLGDQYGIVLEQGDFVLGFDEDAGTFAIDYYENRLPVAPPSYPAILRRHLPELVATLMPDDPDLLEFQSIVFAFEQLPAQTEADPGRVADRQREQTVAKRRLSEVARRSEPVRQAIARAIADYHGTPGDPASFDLMDELLEAQSYRMASWRVAAEEINYRRFFAINELAAVRQEEPAVFAAAHELTLSLLAEGKVHGLRLDHVDGLYDPAAYVTRLQRAYRVEVARRRAVGDEETVPGGTVLASPEEVARSQERGRQWEAMRPRLDATLDAAVASGRLDPRPIYLLVEKIVEHGEALPRDWAVHGTTGYEFANAVGGLFVDPAGRKPFDEVYTRFLGHKVSFADMVYDCKRLIMRVGLASEVAVLASSLDRIAEQNRRLRDFTLNNLRDALREVIACFPVYRTYVTCDGEDISASDRRTIETAVAAAIRRNPATDRTVFHFLRDVLLLQGGTGSPEQRATQCAFAMRFQQLSGPVMAKGLEDTAFYRYNRLTSLNEVGGDPTTFGVPVAAFHRENAERARHWPNAMLSSSTHDTKRSEDVRARISVLSEVPREWRIALNRWARLNRKARTRVAGGYAPDRNDEYLLYQTLLGAWPLDVASLSDDAWETFVDRIVAYMDKAAREAQVQTSWVNPNEEYDSALVAFVRRVLDREAGAGFLADFATLQAKVATVGAMNGLAQQALRLTAPGMPDVYQGTELWDLSLVDPDNRRPVDYDLRSRLLRDLSRRRDKRALAAELLERWEDGRVKLYLTATLLRARAEAPDLFERGEYLPLAASGPRADHVVAFARRLPPTAGGPAQEIVVIVPRLNHGLTGGATVAPLGEAIWGETTVELPREAAGGTYRDLLTDTDVPMSADAARLTVRLADALSTFPIAVLERQATV